MSSGTVRSDLRVDRTYGHINTDTAEDAPHVERDYTLFTDLEDTGRPQEWTFRLRMPRYVADCLTSADWELVLRGIDRREPGKNFSIVEAAILGAKLSMCTPETLQTFITEAVCENLYRVFSRKQIAAGNKAWVVPPSMQKVSNPDGN